MSVRFATTDDAPEIIAMVSRLHAEIGLFPIADNRISEMVNRAMNRHGGIIGVIGDTGKIEASLCLTIDQLWYTDDWCLIERWNFVNEECRRSSNAKDLIAFAEDCSEKIKLPLVIGVLSNERTEAKVRLYERALGKPVGAYWVKNGAWGQANVR